MNSNDIEEYVIIRTDVALRKKFLNDLIQFSQINSRLRKSEELAKKIEDYRGRIAEKENQEQEIAGKTHNLITSSTQEERKNLADDLSEKKELIDFEILMMDLQLKNMAEAGGYSSIANASTSSIVKPTMIPEEYEELKSQKQKLQIRSEIYCNVISYISDLNLGEFVP